MDLLESLIASGFTEYEARVYLELLRDHPTTGYQISKVSGIPRSMVYEALGRLRNRGAVLESTEEKATLYRPLPPDVLMDYQEQAHQEIMSVLRSGLGQLYTTKEEDRLWSIDGQIPVFAYAGQMIRDAKQAVRCVLADRELKVLEKELIQAHSRGVEVSALLTGSASLGVGQVARHPPLESELQAIQNMAIVMVDDREVLIANVDGETTATITRNHHLIFIAGQFVWMELFAQRIYARLDKDLLARLEPEDRRIFESLRRNT